MTKTTYLEDSYVRLSWSGDFYTHLKYCRDTEKTGAMPIQSPSSPIYSQQSNANAATAILTVLVWLQEHAGIVDLLGRPSSNRYSCKLFSYTSVRQFGSSVKWSKYVYQSKSRYYELCIKFSIFKFFFCHDDPPIVFIDSQQHFLPIIVYQSNS